MLIWYQLTNDAIFGIFSDMEDQDSSLEEKSDEYNNNDVGKGTNYSEISQQAQIYIPKFEKLKKSIIKPESFWHEQVNLDSFIRNDGEFNY